MQRSTGAVVETETVTVVKGSYFVTPEQQERDRELRKKRIPIMQAKKITEFLGRYYALSLDNCFSSLPPATVSRLVFLATFLRYKDDSLYLTKRTPLHRTNLAEALGVSRTTADRFMDEVCPRYLWEDADKNLHMNTSVFSFGPVPDDMKQYQKVYMNAVQKLYRSTSTANHKHLGYVFMLLPFVNIEHNILCHNPYTPNPAEMEPMTLQEFCVKVGISSDRSTMARLRRIYASLLFEVDGSLQLFCNFATDGVHSENQKIFVNPRILYSGNDYESMRLLTALMVNPS